MKPPALVLLLSATSAFAQSHGNTKNTSGTVAGVPAVTDQTTFVYKGLNLGLYNDLTTGLGTNTPPSLHDSWGKSSAAAIQTIDGAVVGMILGLSNAVLFGTQLPTNFVNQTDTLRSEGIVNSTFNVVEGALGSTPSSEWENNNYGSYTHANVLLKKAGFTPSQVQILFIENADANVPPDGLLSTATSLAPPAPHIPPLSTDADYWNLIYNMGIQFRYLRTQYPNLQQVFLHARIYAGYAVYTASNPEPFAFEQSMAIKYLVMAQSLQQENGTIDPVAGDLLTNCPWIGWGYYMWANGDTPRDDGLTWLTSDYQTTGGSAYVHPNGTGVAQQVNWPVNGATAFYLASPYSAPWYAAPAAR
jgi:hypothetical protein